MSMDSQDKRASALRMGWLPQPDSSVDVGDRYQLLWQYRLEITPGTSTGGDGRQFLGVVHNMGDSPIIGSSMGNF